ncbi:MULTISPECIES: DUF29 domain-containing protein [Pseudanabaena]|uniref:DUF29 domain-containing protein n=2 Tax=Pseudanabaena TaxID=1152 RepID=L8N1D9_9CYAN|nr:MULTISPECIES: DUF29 domain-containing protein [Pseudanabaena]ELS34022.1 protein of unknown function DUF29 [Pseudanabaena biceps PCC 7429]MDG3493750.1 DUF29 domain-containing protein [Pseudanabaena catenata USMAC16]
MTQIVARKPLYESDYLLWIQETIAKLKNRDFENLDLENLIEEIEDLGRSQRKELESRLATLLAHLLKRMYVNMPDCFNGWENTIREQRLQIEVLLNNYPSLKSYWDRHFSDAWRFALKHTRKEYQSKGFTFPNEWEFEKDTDSIVNIDFWD